MKQIVIFLILIAFIALSYKLYPRIKGRYLRYVEESKVIDTKAPNREMKTLNGEKWSFKQHLGKKIVMIFWAKSCKYCIKEIPNINKFYNKHKDDNNLEIMSYSRDLSLDTTKLKEFIDEKSITYPILIEPNLLDKKKNFLKEFKVFGLPSIWVIDEEGNMIVANLRSIDEVLDFI